MVKKTAMDEQMEKLEQELQEMKLEGRTQMEEFRRLLERRPRRPHPRENDDGTIVGEEDGGSPTETESSLDGSQTPRHHRVRGRKLEIPVFEGGEALGWLVKVEFYFRINGVEEDDMLEAVVIALDGRALNWYQ